jgi:hypothetical protein
MVKATVWRELNLFYENLAGSRGNWDCLWALHDVN